MTDSSATTQQVRQFLAALGEHSRLWLTPAVALSCLALLYALFAPPAWKATQSLLVRDEAAGGERQGRFDTTEAMKNAQETILELARNNAVVRSALEEVGPPARHPEPDSWPTADDVRDARDAIEVSAPKGAEFGTTEVIHLSVTAGSRPRALDMAAALSGALEACLKDIRDRKAQSVVAELEQEVDLAQNRLDAATERLEAMESEVGSDLGELRSLNDSGRGEGNLRITATRVRDDLRAARAAQVAREQQLALLEAAADDPDALLSTPNELLQSQPALQRLKEGLVDAQLRTAQAMGRMSEDHPLARAALAAEDEIRAKLRQELTAATQVLRADLRVGEARVGDIQKQYDDVQDRLHRLAGLRARYGNLVNEVRQCSTILDEASAALADARARQAAAGSASLITRLDDPQADTRPVGPGKTTIVAVGAAGGVFGGLGLVFLLHPPVVNYGRRATDRVKYGRRATDADTPARREGDRPT